MQLSHVPRLLYVMTLSTPDPTNTANGLNLYKQRAIDVRRAIEFVVPLYQPLPTS